MLSTLFNMLNDPIRAGLASLHITPVSYAFLFPPEINYNQIQSMVDKGVFPTVEGLAPAFTYFMILNLTRYLHTVFLFKPLARASMQLKEVPLEAVNEIDDQFKNSNAFVPSRVIKEYCHETGKNAREVQKYLWHRKENATIQRKVVKYVEASWRFVLYTSLVVLGYRALFLPETASWITTSINFYLDWPLHDVSPAIMLYYQMQIGSYFHQLLWTEVNHSDAWEMIAHHCITTTLLIASYLTNYTRIGSMILFIHDLSDVFLELAKVLNYTSLPKSNNWIKPYVDGLFAIFMITFFITRLVIFPKHVLYSLLTEGWEIYGCEWAGCYFFLGLLGSLQVLHVFWFTLIARMTYRLLVVGQVEGDVRSDDEVEEGKEEKEEQEEQDEADDVATDKEDMSDGAHDAVQPSAGSAPAVPKPEIKQGARRRRN